MSNMNEIMKACEGIEYAMNAHAEKTETKMRELDDQILQLKQRGAPMDHIDVSQNKGSLGSAVRKGYTENADLFAKAKTATFNVPFEIKNTITTSTGSSQVQNHATLPGLSSSTIDPNRISTVIRTIPTSGVTTAHYSRYMHSITSDDLVQPGETTLKQEVSTIYTPIAQNAITIAAWCKITEQALNAANELEAVVDTHLRQEVLKGIDSVLISGTTETAWPFAGLKSLAVGYPSTTYTDMADVIAECAAHMRWAGLQPNVVVLNPMEYLSLILAKDTSGRYMTDTYLSGAPLMAHGCRIVFSGEVDVGEALLLDTNYMQLGMSMDLKVEMGRTSDDFVRNLVVIRAEAMVIPIYRHSGAAQLATPLAG